MQTILAFATQPENIMGALISALAMVVVKVYASRARVRAAEQRAENAELKARIAGLEAEIKGLREQLTEWQERYIEAITAAGKPCPRLIAAKAA